MRSIPLCGMSLPCQREEECCLIPDSLYDLALKYKKTKLWKLLWDSRLFGVRFPDVDIGDCGVMGKLGEPRACPVTGRFPADS